MSTALVTQNAITNLDDLQRVAKLLAASGYFDAKGTTEQAIAQLATKILAGQEMGYGPFASVQGIHVIQGKPAMSANLMAAAVKASARYDYRVRQMDDSAVKVEFFERISGKLESLGVSTFTAEDAKKAGTQNMAKYGRNMLFARAMSNGVRWYCPDVFFGNSVYTPEEINDGNGDYIDVDYRNVDATTGEIKTPPPAQTNGNERPAASKPTAQLVDVPPEVNVWESPNDAYEWAVGIGASDNVFAARNAMTKIVEAQPGGKFTKANATAIYVAYYHDRMARAQEKANAALDAIDMESVQESDPEGVFA